MTRLPSIGAFAAVVSCLALVESSPAQQSRPETLLENAFQQGAILQDTNGDHISDAVCGHVVVTSTPSTADNAAAANLAARLGYETSDLTLPIVVSGAIHPAFGCPAEKAELWVGRTALAGAAPVADREMQELQIGEGGVFTAPGGLVFAGADAEGLLAAADDYAAHAPYQWSTTGEKLEAIARTINARLATQKVAATAELAGITYRSDQPGIRRAILQISGSAPIAEIQRALSPEEGELPLHSIHAREVELLMPDGAFLLLPAGGVGATAPQAAPPIPPADQGEGGEPPRLLDLHGLYGIHGLLSGSPKKLVPESVAAKLYVPAGDSGIQMANLAARLGLETTGITLPIAFPATGVSPVDITTPVVIAGNGALVQHARDNLGAPAGTAMDKLVAGEFGKDGAPELPKLEAGEGELQVVDRAFAMNPALLVRGDDAGQSTALQYAAERLPYLWEPSKQFLGLDEMRLDLARFFSLRSSTGQATAALFDLDEWMDQIVASGKTVNSAEAEVDVDESDPGLAKFIRDEIATRLKTSHVTVTTGTLHAGTKCCSADPDLHNVSLVIPYKDRQPTFRDDFTIPWEGRRMMSAVSKAAAQMPKGVPVTLEVRVSEGPEERVKIKQQLEDMLKQAGASQTNITVLCSYKSGYSWLVDEIEPLLKGKEVARIGIEFAPNPDPNHQSLMRALYRWNDELFPVDEVLARDLNIPLKNIAITKMDDDKGPTYRVHAYDGSGKEILTREFTVKTVSRPYSDQFPQYESVNVETGWVNMVAAGKTLLDERVESDTEEFWDHYQKETLPRIFEIITKQNDGKLTADSQPLFDTLRIGYKLSEPDYEIGIDQERISSLEGLQEDTFYNTENFFYMMGDLLGGAHLDYLGRIIPISYPSRDGEDGQVDIEFYAKDAGMPQVRLKWMIDGDPVEHMKEQKLYAVPSSGRVRLVAARVQAGKEGVESLTWRMPVDFNKYNYDQWIVLEEKSHVERTIMSAEQASAQVHWLEKMHQAGLYKDELTYPHLGSFNFQFELPEALNAPDHAKNEIVLAHMQVDRPATKRPMITDFTPTSLDASGHFVQWENPIPPAEEEHMLSRLATYPGVSVYWMGRSYLGGNIWAADMTLPTPSTLHSMAKATTLKATIIYSGRQHANEVSSTSHILKLGEELVLDPKWRATLNKVNVVLHPITNVDGANMSIDLAKISPLNMLHPGYHGSLTADVVSDQDTEFPIYPESATRRLLWNAWLPDAFENPHGYPTHEWVQPFSGYSAWVVSRMGAETGRNWWVPRGWFTSLGYLSDDQHPKSREVTYALRDMIVNEMIKTPGVLEMSQRENDRYMRFQHWDAESYQEPIYKGIRINMALKGTEPPPTGGRAGMGGTGSLMVRYPDITWDDGYTEAPDETVYGKNLQLAASAGLAFDHAHLEYLDQGKLKTKRTQHDAGEGVTWHVERARPILPVNPPQLPHADGVKD
jgi:Zinc carboxypeptidase